MDKHTRPAVGVANVITFNDFVLIGMRKGKHAGGMWGFPGGHLELYESFEEAAARETKEEAGIIVPKHNLKVWTVENTLFREEGKHYVVVFVVTRWTPDMGKPINVEPDKCEGWEWRDWYHLPQPLMPGIDQLLQKDMAPPGIIGLCKGW